jgi:hypothetical protein
MQKQWKAYFGDLVAKIIDGDRLQILNKAKVYIAFVFLNNLKVILPTFLKFFSF